MRVLAINCGSSSLKFELIDVGSEGSVAPGQNRKTAHGKVERIGGSKPAVDFSSENGESLRQLTKISDHGEAIRQVLDWLRSIALIGPEGPEAVGHRIVHGGDRFAKPVVIDDKVMSVIEALVDLAPLHNKPSLAAIHATRRVLGSSVPMVAVFDTAFHCTLPERASQYAIPQELTAKYRIRRYGFHGLAHRYMTERYVALAGRSLEQTKLITLQLGNGCSVTAVEGGRSVDTSMGFTPLEGLMMGTRSGSIDPCLVGFLSRQEGVDVAQVEDWLNTRSGLLGVSGISRDVRELLEAEVRGDARASLALEMFCYQVRKYVGAYLAVLGGADAVIFGGGIGQNAPQVRARVCANMSWCGLELDPDSNANAVGCEGRISTEASTVDAYVIPVDEEMMIAQDTASCLCHHGQGLTATTF